LIEKYEMLETFELDLAFMCFNTEFLARQIQGLKSINDIIKAVKLQNYKFLNIN